MGNKEIYSSGKITASIIINWIAWGLIYGLIYGLIGGFAINIIYKIIVGILGKSIESWIIQSVLLLIAEGFLIFIIWKSSIKSTFKNKLIRQSDVSKVIKNLFIITIIFFIAHGTYNFININNTIEETIATTTQSYERLMSYVSNNKNKIAEYQKQLDEALEKAKSELYKRLTILEIGIAAVYLVALPLNKKEISKYAVY